MAGESIPAMRKARDQAQPTAKPTDKAPAKTPRQRLIALGPGRIRKFESVCAMLKRMGNPKQYELTDGEKQRLIGLVKLLCAEVVSALEGKKPASNGFVLDNSPGA